MFDLNNVFFYIIYIYIPIIHIMCIKLYYEFNIIALKSLIYKLVFALIFISNSNLYT